jgi:O-acetyl-ADP-ribose deacetylase (regulator of RNase III)
VGARIIAFPAIATGVYGYPSRAAAAIAVATLKSTPTTVVRASLVAFDGTTYDLYTEFLAT